MAEETFKKVSVAALQFCHEAAAKKALEDEEYLPIFAEIDAELAEYEASVKSDNAIEKARARLRMKRSA
jgi:hypothetical protein